MKKLYFEGAGCVSRADVPNCRIRTDFHLDNGNIVYLEISGMETTLSTAPCYKNFKNYGVIDHLFTITGTWDDGTSRHRYERGGFAFEYNMENILALVNSLGASFDAIEVLDDLSGYRVHGDRGAYNLGDEFAVDTELVEARHGVEEYIRGKEIARGERSICYSLWVDAHEPALLHYKNFRTGENFDIYPAVPADPAQLPVLNKSNAIPGCYYASGEDGWQQLRRLYRISEEYAREHELMYLDRCETSNGDYAIWGSDIFRR